MYKPTQKDRLLASLYYNYPQTPTTAAEHAGIPAPSARRELRELEDAKRVRWIAADQARNRISGYVRV